MSLHRGRAEAASATADHCRALDGLAALGATRTSPRCSRAARPPNAEASVGRGWHERVTAITGCSTHRSLRCRRRERSRSDGDEGSDSGDDDDDSHEQDAVADATEVDSEAARVQEKEGNADEALGAAASARPRKTRSTYRDSVFNVVLDLCRLLRQHEARESVVGGKHGQAPVDAPLNSPPVAQMAVKGRRGRDQVDDPHRRP